MMTVRTGCVDRVLTRGLLQGSAKSSAKAAFECDETWPFSVG